MKIEINYIKSEETLVQCGNRFFTKAQIKEIIKA